MFHCTSTGSDPEIGLDTAFVYVFLAELCLRILVEGSAGPFVSQREQGRHFFWDLANWFDAVLAP